MTAAAAHGVEDIVNAIVVTVPRAYARETDNEMAHAKRQPKYYCHWLSPTYTLDRRSLCMETVRDMLRLARVKTHNNGSPIISH